MKNVFWVINKEKIYAYVVSVLTIVTLFFMSSMLNSDFKETESTSSNVVENKVINNEINNTTSNMENNVVENNVVQN